MKLIKQYDYWSCGVCSYAMVLGISWTKFHDALGKCAKKASQYNQKIQKKFPVTTNIIPDLSAFRCIPLENCAQTALKFGRFTIKFSSVHFTKMAYFKRFISGKRGIIVIKSFNSKNKSILHAVAWDGDLIYDPSGDVYPLRDLRKHFRISKKTTLSCIQSFWWVIPTSRSFVSV